jgi:hypothetical protein
MTSRRGPGDRGWAWGALLLLAALLALPAVAQELPATAREHRADDELRPAVAGCPVCDLWLRYREVILQASQEVGSLENGVIYFYHAQNPGVIEPLVRFAYQRAELEASLRGDPSLRARLGEACEHNLLGDGSVRLEISTGAHGFFAILTSADREIVSRLQEEASQAVRGRIVRF